MTNALTYRGPALSVLHEQYTKQRRVDEQAPVHSHQHIVIHTPAGRVWQSLTDVAHWHTTLEPGVRHIRLPHGVQVDAPFTRSNKGVRMRARFALVSAEHPGRAPHRPRASPRRHHHRRCRGNHGRSTARHPVQHHQAARRARDQPDNAESSGRSPRPTKTPAWCNGDTPRRGNEPKPAPTTGARPCRFVNCHAIWPNLWSHPNSAGGQAPEVLLIPQRVAGHRYGRVHR